MLADLYISLAFIFGLSILMHFALYRIDNAHDFAFTLAQALAMGFLANSIFIAVLAFCFTVSDVIF